VKQQVSSVNSPRIVNGKQNMLCKVGISEINCFASSFTILGMFVQPSCFPKEWDLDVTVPFACVRVFLSVIKSFDRLPRKVYKNHENVFTPKPYQFPRPSSSNMADA
jgi:hypothetical protein